MTRATRSPTTPKTTPFAKCLWIRRRARSKRVLRRCARPSATRRRCRLSFGYPVCCARSRLQIDHQMEFGRQHHRQVCRLFAAHDAADVVAGLAIGLGAARAIADEAARLRLLALREDGPPGLTRHLHPSPYPL